MEMIKLDCYDEVLKVYRECEYSKLSNEQLMQKCYTHLIKYSKGKNVNAVQNCMLLLLGLMNEKGLDLYHSRGKSHKKLTQEEKEEVKKLLESL